jgi:uncharacterized membrane protein YfcA
MGLTLLLGGFAGSSLGVWIFTLLRGMGQLDLVIKLSFLCMLGGVGLLMLKESIEDRLRRHRRPTTPRQGRRTWADRLPLKLRFRRSRLYISVLLPLVVGAVVGILAAIMGVGGGFIMVPAMIYLLGMPTSVVVGTSLFQIIFVTANVTFLQAVTNQTVDVVLALLLLVGGVIGAQIGVRAGARLRGEQLRALLALLVLGVAVKIGFDLVATPADFYTLGGAVR